MATPLQVREQLCTIYDRLRYHQNKFAIMQPYLEDAVRHCGGYIDEYVPPIMRADFPEIYKQVWR